METVIQSRCFIFKMCCYKRKSQQITIPAGLRQLDLKRMRFKGRGDGWIKWDSVHYWWLSHKTEIGNKFNILPLALSQWKCWSFVATSMEKLTLFKTQHSHNIPLINYIWFSAANQGKTCIWWQRFGLTKFGNYCGKKLTCGGKVHQNLEKDFPNFVTLYWIYRKK